ncbi:MAG: AAA family ATPase [Spirochaetes bacterium]|nr:AAA family ATPase [Spirochaetota bacterium]
MNGNEHLALSSGYYGARLLEDGPYLQVFRATRETDGIPVLIKLPTPSADRMFDRSLLLAEFAAVKNSRSEGILRPLKLIDRTDLTALILQGFDGTPLASRADLRRRANGRFLAAARAIVAAIRLVHESGLAHLCLSPRHIYLGDRGDGFEARITGFGRLGERGDLNPASPDLRDISLEYLSPESSGRLNRPAGPLADLYSLGVIFYEMLTGIVPFHSDNAADLLYWHMARTPVPPREINGSVPEALSETVTRLLAKDPADRFTDAEALETALEHCGNDRRKLPRGTRTQGGVPGRIILPPRIFGRERQRLDLFDAYRRACAGARVFTAISGYAGIGKTVLAMELGEEARCRGGTFLTGKFEQYGSEKPYHAFSAAFGREILRILGGSDAGLSTWRKRIAKALRPNAGTIAECVPELRHVIGDTGPRPRIDPANEEHRFLYNFGRFAGLFAGPEAPLVVFIDDLQWADAPSLRLMKYLASESSIGYFLMIGAYRDNEVGPDHPLAATLEEIRDAGDLQRLEVGPLAEEPVREMIAIVTGSDPDAAAPLAAVLFRKTGGNPFFLQEYLSAAQMERALATGPNGAFTWDRGRIEGMPATENVAALLVERLHRLPGPDLELLKAASCIGSRFDRGLLQRCIATDLAAYNRTLRRCVDEGFIAAEEGGACAFSHDRVQEAAYSLLTPEERERHHLVIGRLLLRRFGDSLSDSLFTVADHLNLASGLMTSPEERAELHGLNRLAGDKARLSAAWGAAAAYYKKAVELLGPGSWKEHHDETIALHRDYAECLHLSGAYDKAGQVLDEVMPHARLKEEKVGLLIVTMHIQLMQARFSDVVETGNEALGMLGFTLRSKGIEEEIAEEYRRIDALLKERGIRFILELPRNDSFESDAINDITRIMSLSYFYTDPEMLHLTTLKATSYIIANGISRCSYSWIVGFCVIDGFIKNNYRRAFDLGELSVQQCMSDAHLPYFCETNQRFVNVVFPWVRHLRETEELNPRGIEFGMAHGDIDYTCFTLTHMEINRFLLGENLEKCLKGVSETCDRVTMMNHRLVSEVMLALKQIVQNLIVPAGPPNDTGNTITVENEYAAIIDSKRNFISLFHYYIGIMQIHYLDGDYDCCISAYDASIEISACMMGIFHHADRVFYHALAHCALLEVPEERDRAAHLEEIGADLELLRVWAFSCPENFLHRRLLVEAELARLRGETVAAMGLYDRAIESAQVTGYRQIEAVACERAGLFWHTLGKEDFSRIYLRRACDRYRDWGAARKVSLLEARHPWLTASWDRAGSPENLDPALIGLLQSLRESECPTELIGLLAQGALRYTGAERLLLFLTFRERTYLLAEASADAITVALVPFSEAERKPSLYPVELARTVLRTGTPVSGPDGPEAVAYLKTPYFSCRTVRSMLCIPSDTGSSTLVWYLEHGRAAGAFGGISAKALDMLAVQADRGIREMTVETGAYIGASITVREGGHSVMIPHTEIVYVSSVRRHSVIHTQGNSYETPLLLRKIEESLPHGVFLRVHKQYIVNIRFALNLQQVSQNRYMLRLGDDDDTMLPVGRAHVKALKARLATLG